ncbi:MAG: signal peptidase I [Chloroflexi bacterium]|nr:signal peptidase I [Chloroflexota bacterium]
MKATFKEILETVLMALAIFLLLQTSIMGFVVDGSSMEPNLHTGQRLLVNKAVYFRTEVAFLQKLVPWIKSEGQVGYFFHPPERGEVVLFYFPRDNRQIYIKRVIALPGEAVEIRDGQVFVNGRLIKEPVTIPQARAPFGPITVPANQYFVLGDNRNGSSDSRSGWTVPYNNIIGKAWLTYGRPWEWGVAPNFDLPLAQASPK